MLCLFSNSIMKMVEVAPILNICEKILGVICILLMFFLVQKDQSLWLQDKSDLPLVYSDCFGVLLLNYLDWGFYFC